MMFINADHRVYLVHKEVWAAIVGDNEAIAFHRVEPFDLACIQVNLKKFTETNTQIWI